MQRPSGIGTSHFILNLITSLIRFTIESSKILLCTPTNAAVEDLKVQVSIYKYKSAKIQKKTKIKTTQEEKDIEEEEAKKEMYKAMNNAKILLTTTSDEGNKKFLMNSNIRPLLFLKPHNVSSLKLYLQFNI